ncbi:plasmid related protein [Telluria aromaticivorans]|uniref:Plasmid related protein n=1 Tax=Telluria aromaticivorans TaxID=2725995 RepID=A0A7Y2NZ73_9BURK|nr:plasmid related protein [Telluria aromaticivorans]NNG22749.1 plasmid related protein [Telluria aromaticivorans]
MAEDIRADQAAIHDGGQMLSSYRIAPTVPLWLINEANRASTTILLPDKY